MAYGLPARGETDWDAKLVASIEAVKATADAAETPTGAQTKADAAEAGAVATAAADATSKADAAEAAAIAAAATDATTKASQAEADANAYTDTAVSTHNTDPAAHGLDNAWQSWVPTVGGVSATVEYAVYTQQGSRVHGEIYLLTTSAASNVITITLPPVAPSARYSASRDFMVGTANGFDVSVPTGTIGGVLISIANGGKFVMYSSGGTYWNNTSPFTWASGDHLRLVFDYEAA